MIVNKAQKRELIADIAFGEEEIQRLLPIRNQNQDVRDELSLDIAVLRNLRNILAILQEE